MPLSDLALTADALMEGHEVHSEIGLDGFLAKPIDAAALRRVLDDVAGRATPIEPAPAPAVNEDGTTYLDLARLATLRDELGLDIVPHLLRLHIGGVRSKMVSLPASTDGDRAEIARIAHAVKGAAGNIAAMRLQVPAGDVERLGAGGDQPSARSDAFRTIAERRIADVEQLGAEAA